MFALDTKHLHLKILIMNAFPFNERAYLTTAYCEFCWNTLRAVLAFSSLLVNSSLRLSRTESLFGRSHGKVVKTGKYFLTMQFHPCSLSSRHCSWYGSPGLGDHLLMHWDAPKFIFSQMRDERRGLVWWKLLLLGSFSENAFHILCGKLHYWRWWGILGQNPLHWTEL